MKSLIRRLLRGLIAVCLLVPFEIWPQAWPVKPIRVVVPYLPGPTDQPIRLLGPTIQELLGQPLVIDNRPGANGTIGAQIVAQSPADGYTLLFTNANPLVFGPATQKNVPYDPVRDFTPITAVMENIDILVANPSLPANSVKGLIEYSKANPGKLFYASPGRGSGQHINGQNFNRLAGTDLTAVHYVSYAQIIPAVLSGQVTLAFLILQPVKSLVDSGKMKLIAVQDARRAEILPGVATIAETMPGYEKAAGWAGLLAPARLPQPIVERLHAAVLNAINRPDTRARLAGDGSSRIIANTPEQFAATLKGGVERTARIVKELRINVTE